MDAFLHSPGVPSALFLAVALALLFLVPLCWMLCSGRGSGVGNTSTCGQSSFSLYVRAGRVRNLICSPCDRVRQRYPLANTCQVPFLASLSDVYTFVFAYKTDGLFLEVGAYDGESFSNTSGLADIGWSGHYFEPVPQYADAARERHAGNAPRVQVHTLAVSDKDGDTIMVSAAGPFSSAVDDEISTVNASALSSTLSALGWSHSADAPRIPATTVSLNSFCKKHAIAPKQVDVMVRTAAIAARRRARTQSSRLQRCARLEHSRRHDVPNPPPPPPVSSQVIDVEGHELDVLRGFDLARWAPKLVIIEVQELQRRYRENKRVQEHAAEIFSLFALAGYSILYKDIVNTIFIHKDVQCLGGA